MMNPTPFPLDVEDVVEHCWMVGLWTVTERPDDKNGRLKIRPYGSLNFVAVQVEVHFADVRLVGKGGVH